MQVLGEPRRPRASWGRRELGWHPEAPSPGGLARPPRLFYEFAGGLCDLQGESRLQDDGGRGRGETAHGRQGAGKWARRRAPASGFLAWDA